MDMDTDTLNIETSNKDNNNVEYRSYYDESKSLWQNLKSLLFPKQRRIGREHFFIGNIILYFLSFIIFLPFIVTIIGYSISIIQLDSYGYYSMEWISAIPIVILIIIPIIICSWVWWNLSIKRLHDINKSWVHFLPIYIFSVLTPVSLFFVEYMCYRKGTLGENDYGPSPDALTGYRLPLFSPYYDNNLGYWGNVKQFFFKVKGRMNRLPYFWGGIVLNMATATLVILTMIPFLLIVLAMAIGNYLAVGTFIDTNTEIIGNSLLVFLVFFLLILAVKFYSGVILKLKRLQDLNFAPKWGIVILAILFLIPYINILGNSVFELYLLIKKGNEGKNKFGEDILEK